jgi:RNA polymerase sigma factor (sigma-70 family)
MPATDQTDDRALLRQFATENSEAAFATLVARHIGLVHSAALRQTGDPHAAEEITQAVFIILARKAGSLGGKVILPGWLYQTARLTAANYLRTEIRRTRREQESHMNSLVNETEPSDEIAWQQIAPLLDTAMGGLNEADRNAIVLRFFENKSMGEIAAALDAPEATVRKRVTRAVERLRKFFMQRGVMLTATAIAGAVSANSVQAAPVALANSVTAAIAKGAAAGGSTLTLAKGTLKLMAWSKAKMAIVVGVGVLLAAGTTTVVVKKVQDRNAYHWQMECNGQKDLETAPPMIAIAPALSRKENPKAISGWTSIGSGSKRIFVGHGIGAKVLVQAAYSTYGPNPRTRRLSRIRFDFEPPGLFDFIASLPEGSDESLRAEIARRFDVRAEFKTVETEVLLLQVKNRNTAQLRPTSSTAWKVSGHSGEIIATKISLSGLAQSIEGELRLDIPVLDRTDLDGDYDCELRWDSRANNAENLKRAVLDQLGLQLVPSREPIEMLVVEKVK